MSARINLTGKQFGRLTVLKIGHTDKNGNLYWLCKCDCGKEKEIMRTALVSGNTKSCGCLNSELSHERQYKHGLSHKRIHNIWTGMKNRCGNANVKAYRYYGGRGIKVCEQWKNDFMSFYEWSMNNGYDETKSIDRIDSNDNYEPENCRWVELSFQTSNTRSNHNITFRGKTLTMTQWSRELGFTVATLSYRLNKKKWPIEKALTTPVRRETI